MTADEEDISAITALYTMLVNCIDTDGDSLLDQMEFSDFYMTIAGGDDDNGMLVFCMFDADGDGQVTDSEYTDYLNTSDYDNGGEPMTEAEWEAFVMMFNNYDIDESGGLDFSEFETMIMDGDGDGDGHDHGDWPTFICGNGDEIPFEYVNDGEEDCTDGADEQQYNADGSEINWFDCMDGSQIWISQVNDGNHDCSDGDDEMLDNGGDHGDGDGDGHDHGGDGDGGHDHGGDGDTHPRRRR